MIHIILALLLLTARVPANMPHYVVCAGDEIGAYTQIVDRSTFESLARENKVCAAYETDVDGLVEIDWAVTDTGVAIWKR